LAYVVYQRCTSAIAVPPVGAAVDVYRHTFKMTATQIGNAEAIFLSIYYLIKRLLLPFN
jgi:hypothetical protein